jgi:hypothetical protein
MWCFHCLRIINRLGTLLKVHFGSSEPLADLITVVPWFAVCCPLFCLYGFVVNLTKVLSTLPADVSLTLAALTLASLLASLSLASLCPDSLWPHCWPHSGLTAGLTLASLTLASLWPHSGPADVSLTLAYSTEQ